MKKIDMARELIKRFPKSNNLTLAKKLYEDNGLLFNSVESARDAIRHARNAHGKESRQHNSNPEIFRTPEQIEQARLNPYGLPESHAEKWEPIPFPVKRGRGLIIADSHIPYHRIEPINISFDWAKENKYIDFVYFDGDMQDNLDLSRFEKDPRNRTFKQELEDVGKFLDSIASHFPNAKIIYKKSNHEYRLERFLRIKAPQLFDLADFIWSEYLHIRERGVIVIPHDIYTTIGKLSILHGDEIPITSSVNAARGTYLRTKECTLVAHGHRTSEHSEITLNGTLVTTWSIGCLCDLHPKWMRVNQWNWGCAGLEVDGDDFEIENKRIFKGIIR